tara:strand:+ start:897 stop:1040 length:144 start_codon:yes stop_codon:yes gene_type:complete
MLANNHQGQGSNRRTNQHQAQRQGETWGDDRRTLQANGCGINGNLTG